MEIFLSLWSTLLTKVELEEVLRTFILLELHLSLSRIFLGIVE